MLEQVLFNPEILNDGFNDEIRMAQVGDACPGVNPRKCASRLFCVDRAFLNSLVEAALEAFEYLVKEWKEE